MKNTTQANETDHGKREAFALLREISLEETQSSSAMRSHVRSRRALAKLPFGKVRATVLRRLDVGRVRASLSEFQREDVNQLVCMACHVLGVADGQFPTMGQWKEIFRSVRNGLGTDREAKRNTLVEIIILDPEILALINIPCPPVDDDELQSDRRRIVTVVRDVHRKLISAFQADTSRKRIARFLGHLRFFRTLVALKSGKDVSAPLFNGVSEGSSRQTIFRFREYIAEGEKELWRRQSSLITGEFKSLDSITLGFTACDFREAA